MADRHNILTKSHGHHVVRRHPPSTGPSGPSASTANVSSRVKTLQAVWSSRGDTANPHPPILMPLASPIPPLFHYQSSPALQIPPREHPLQPKNLHKASSSIEEYCVRSVERIKITPETSRIRRERSKKLLSNSPLLQRRRTRRSRAEGSDSATQDQGFAAADTDALDTALEANAEFESTQKQSQSSAPPPFSTLTRETYQAKHVRGLNSGRDILESHFSQEPLGRLPRAQTGVAHPGSDPFDDHLPDPTAPSDPEILSIKDMDRGGSAEASASSTVPKMQRLRKDWQKGQDSEINTTKTTVPKTTISVRDRIRSFQIAPPLENPEEEKGAEQTTKAGDEANQEIRHLAKRFEETTLDTIESQLPASPDNSIPHSNHLTSLDRTKAGAADSPTKPAPAPAQIFDSKPETNTKRSQKTAAKRIGSIIQNVPTVELPRSPATPVAPKIEQPLPCYIDATSIDNNNQSPRLKHQVTNKIAHLTEKLAQGSSPTPEVKKFPVPKPLDIPQYLNAEKRPSPSPVPILTSAISPDLVLQHPAPQHHTPPMRNLPVREQHMSPAKSLADQLGNMIDDALEKDWTPYPPSNRKATKKVAGNGDETEGEPVLEDWLEKNVKRRSDLFQSQESRHRREHSQVVETPNEITPTSRSSSPVNKTHDSHGLATKTAKQREVEEKPALPNSIPRTSSSHEKASTEKTVIRQASNKFNVGDSHNIEPIVDLLEPAVESKTPPLVQKTIRTRIKHLHDRVQSQTRIASHNSTHSHTEHRPSGSTRRRRKASDEYYNTNEHTTKIIRASEKQSLDGNDADVDERGSSSGSEKFRKKYEIYVRESFQDELAREAKRNDAKRIHDQADASHHKKPQEHTRKEKSRPVDKPKTFEDVLAPPQPAKATEPAPQHTNPAISKSAPWRWWKLVLVDKPPAPSSTSSSSRPTLSNPPVPPARTSSMKVGETQNAAAYRRMRSMHEMKTKERAVEYGCSGCDFASAEAGDGKTLRKAGTESNDSLAQHLLGVLTRRYPRKQREIRRACDVHDESHKPFEYVCQAQTSDVARSEAAHRVVRPPTISSITTFAAEDEAHLLSPSTPAMASKDMSDTCDGAEMKSEGSERVFTPHPENRTEKKPGAHVDDGETTSSQLGGKDESPAKGKSKAREGAANIVKTVEGQQSAWAVAKAQKAEESVKRVEVVVCFQNGPVESGGRGGGRGGEGKGHEEGWEVEVSVRNRGRLKRKRLTVD